MKLFGLLWLSSSREANEPCTKQGEKGYVYELKKSREFVLFLVCVCYFQKFNMNMKAVVRILLQFHLRKQIVFHKPLFSFVLSVQNSRIFQDLDRNEKIMSVFYIRTWYFSRRSCKLYWLCRCHRQFTIFV